MTSTVSVIDDDDHVRRWAVEVAVQAGHQAVGFQSAESFLEAIPQSRPGCLLLDLQLGGMNGIELQSELIRRGKRLPIIAMSGKADVADAVRLLESGAITLLEKPCTVEELTGAIERALREDEQALLREEAVAELLECANSLMPRQRVVLDRLVEGRLNKSIARELDVSERTIESDRAKIFKRFGVESIAELAVRTTHLRMHFAHNQMAQKHETKPESKVSQDGPVKGIA